MVYTVDTNDSTQVTLVVISVVIPLVVIVTLIVIITGIILVLRKKKSTREGNVFIMMTNVYIICIHLLFQLNNTL